MEPENVRKTCLHSRHVALGAHMSPFAGFDMPIEYAGLDTEHSAVRTSTGVFDVSHMGEVLIEGPEAEKFVNYIFSNDVTAIAPGQILYGMMLYDNGGTVDDLLVYKNSSTSYFLVINASNIAKDLDWILLHSKDFDVTVTDLCERYGELAVQGPESERILREVLGIEAKDLTFYTFRKIDMDGEEIIVSRTGYTGEDGFEIYASQDMTCRLWDKLMDAEVAPCGLGCRDTLRFEAGLPLYGDELTAEITPLESGLGMFVKLDKEQFLGRDALRKQKEEGVTKKVVGLELDFPGTARHGFEVLDMDGNTIGEITTGYNSLTLGKNLAMALIDARYSAQGTPLQVKIRRKTALAKVVKKRFYTPNYKK